MPHILDVYILIFSLYVVAWSKSCPQAAREWSVKQLQHIADHFAIKEAAVILDALKKQKLEEAIDPWYVSIHLNYLQTSTSLRLHRKVEFGLASLRIGMTQSQRQHKNRAKSREGACFRSTKRLYY
jgi:hypothetical protein